MQKQFDLGAVGKAVGGAVEKVSNAVNNLDDKDKELLKDHAK